ncbi:BAI1-associated protein 3 [Schistosoma japonicum]|nr:BAI1-associated protein 3 [Schistosoma japonicum]
MKIPYQTLETLKTLQNKGYSELIRVLNRTIYRMNAKMRPEIRKNVFHLCWSLRSTPVDKAMHDLIVYLDSNIKTLKINVSSNLLQRCILSIWHECLEQYMEQTIKESEINSTNVGGPGAFLQLKPNFISGDNSLSVIPLSTHEIHEIISNLPTEVDRNQIFRAKYTLERLRKSLGILLEFFFKSSDEQISKENFETEEYHVSW